MTSDVLRRAAEKLREHAAAATAGPWRLGIIFGTVFSDTAGITPITARTYGDAAYSELMHPPVALALADLLDWQVQYVELGGRVGESLAAVARAVLREEQS